MKEIYFYSKCFWCLEDLFSSFDGVIHTEVGYANGRTKNPTYEEVCSGETGHEEVCKVVYDENVISLKSLLTVFFKNLDPTKQYNEIEQELRENQSAVIFSDGKDLPVILSQKSAIEAEFGNPMLTKIAPLSCYYKAESRHQHYFKNHPDEACPL